MEAMNDEDWLQRFIDNPDLVYHLNKPLSVERAEILKQHYEERADYFLWRDSDTSAAYANRLMCLAQCQKNADYHALAALKIGNTLMQRGNLQAAWDQLRDAGAQFLELQNLIGWARTCIPLLEISVQLNHFDILEPDAEKASAILSEAKIYDRLLLLKMNLGIAYSRLGLYYKALEAYEQTLDITLSYPNGAQFLGAVYTNMGIAHSFLGNFDRAQQYHTEALRYFEQYNQIWGTLGARINLADAIMASGDFKHALHHLHDVVSYSQLAGSDYLIPELTAKASIVEACIRLNRFHEAKEMAQEILSQIKLHNLSVDSGRTLLNLALVEAHLQHYENAQGALAEAEQHFAVREAHNWLARVYLLSGQIAFLQNDIHLARNANQVAAFLFLKGGLDYDHALSRLLQARLSLLDGKHDAAYADANEVLKFARRYHLAPLRYSAHLLLGHIQEASKCQQHAARHYFAAIATIEHVQQNLTITLRPDFMEDKQEAFHCLMGILLETGRTQAAFEILERSKIQHWLAYLTSNQQLHWDIKDDQTRILLDELNQLRSQYQGYQHIIQNPLHEDNKIKIGVSIQEIRERQLQLEHRIAYLIERLYLEVGQTSTIFPNSVDYSHLHSYLADEALIAYYNDGEKLYAFVLDAQHPKPHCEQLPISVSELQQVIGQLERNFNRALEVDPKASSSQILKVQAEKLLSTLHQKILSPLLPYIGHSKTWIIVPYGDLHLLPFHLLQEHDKYVLEHRYIITLPLSTLLTRPRVVSQPGSLVLADTWYGQLPDATTEAEMVHMLLGGDLLKQDDVTIDNLRRAPARQVLHIASHSVSRLDAPHMSGMHFHNQQLYFDDLLQVDLPYELITLSACETGKSHIAAGDDVIGLGRNLLYAGAGAIVTSLWRTSDSISKVIMQRFYEGLKQGMMKAEALQHAQISISKDKPDYHPAYWGAFQLIGNNAPLSKI
jgi:CHAT domain-containing protein